MLVSSCAAHFISGSAGPGPNIELNFDNAQSAHGRDRRYDTAYGDGNLVQRLQHKGDAPVLFFFFRHIILSNRSPQSLMRDCLYQLLDHSPSLQSNLKNVMVGHPNVDGVPVDELWKCFSSALSGMDKVYCVIDALDEMELGQEKFLADLLDLGRRNPTSVKLALTSRQLV